MKAIVQDSYGGPEVLDGHEKQCIDCIREHRRDPRC
jgi:hypothetical protein